MAAVCNIDGPEGGETKGSWSDTERTIMHCFSYVEMLNV